MNKLGALALIFISLTVLGIIITEPVWATSENSWTSKSPMHEARGYLGVATVNGKIYAIGGDNSSWYGYPTDFIYGGPGMFSVTNEEYDPATDTWTFKAPMPTPRSNFGIAVYENKIYCIGGVSNNSTSAIVTGVNQVYDPATNMWETKTPMPTPRGELKANCVNGKIYLIGGSDGSRFGFYKTTEVYDPSTDSWTTKAPIPTAVGFYASAVVENNIYLLEGIPNSSIGIFYNRTQIYDPEKDQWSIGTPNSRGWFEANAATTTRANAPILIYVFDETATYSYDPANDSWANGTSMPTARGFAGVAVVNDTFYVIGGEIMPGFVAIGAMSPSAANEQYTPFGHGTVTPTPSPSSTPIQTSTPTQSTEPSNTPTLSPSPSVPEFPSFMVMSFIMAATVLSAIFYRANHSKLKQGQKVNKN